MSGLTNVIQLFLSVNKLITVPNTMTQNFQDLHLKNTKFLIVFLAHRKQEQTLASCTHCIDSPKLLKHLIVAMGLKVESIAFLLNL